MDLEAKETREEGVGRNWSDLGVGVCRDSTCFSVYPDGTDDPDCKYGRELRDINFIGAARGPRIVGRDRLRLRRNPRVQRQRRVICADVHARHRRELALGFQWRVPTREHALCERGRSDPAHLRWHGQLGRFVERRLLLGILKRSERRAGKLDYELVAVTGPVRFSLDVSSPFAAELLEAFIEAGERHGVHAIWGHVEGDSLELVASDVIPQDLIVEILESKVKAPSLHNAGVHPTPAPLFSR